jgi:hypothetical protein
MTRKALLAALHVEPTYRHITQIEDFGVHHLVMIETNVQKHPWIPGASRD